MKSTRPFFALAMAGTKALHSATALRSCTLMSFSKRSSSNFLNLVFTTRKAGRCTKWVGAGQLACTSAMKASSAFSLVRSTS